MKRRKQKIEGNENVNGDDDDAADLMMMMMLTTTTVMMMVTTTTTMIMMMMTTTTVVVVMMVMTRMMMITMCDDMMVAVSLVLMVMTLDGGVHDDVDHYCTCFLSHALKALSQVFHELLRSWLLTGDRPGRTAHSL